MWDTSGKKVWEGEFYPFGEEYKVTESPVVNKKHFIGKEKDSETGLTYFGARYMDESSGRFISADPVRPVDAITSKTNYELLTNPQRLNRYAYGLNNPYRYVDQDGEFAFLIPIAIVSGEALGGLAGHILGATTVAGIAAWIMHEGSEGEEASSPVLPKQGSVDGGVEGAPLVDAGKQGKHVIGHNNEVPEKSKWNKGETGVKETQEAWVNGKPVREGVRIGTASDGRTVKVHQDIKGKIHGYPISHKKNSK